MLVEGTVVESVAEPPQRLLGPRRSSSSGHRRDHLARWSPDTTYVPFAYGSPNRTGSTGGSSSQMGDVCAERWSAMRLISPTDSMFLLAESREHPMHVGGLVSGFSPAEATPRG